MFHTMKVRTKLIGSFGLLMALVLIIGAVGYMGIRTVNGYLGETYEKYFRSAQIAGHTATYLQEVRVHLLSLLFAKDRQKQAERQEKITQYSQKIDEGIARLLEIQAANKEVSAKLEEVKKVWGQFTETRDRELIPAALAGRVDEALALAMGVQAERFKVLETGIEEVLSRSDAAVKQFTVDGNGAAARSTYLFLGVSIAAAGLGIFLAFLLTRVMVAPLQAAAGMMDRVAQGDLTETVAVRSRDEIGRMMESVNRMVEALRGTIHQIRENATRLATASEEVSASADQIAKGSQSQKQQSTRVAASMEQMSATVIEVAKNASTAATAAKEAEQLAGQGSTVVTDVTQTIQGIASTVETSAQAMEALGRRSDQIGEIVAVIDDIADQTNLLALNAAIEAARAGEQGRGFAVVADEVRKLAERTTKATKEIGEMIRAIQQETADAVTAMQAGRREVEGGVAGAQKAASALTQILGSVQRVSGMITQIATAAEEQSAATEEISSNMEGITSVVRETASGVEQSAAASRELSKMATEMQGLVGRFRVNGRV